MLTHLRIVYIAAFAQHQGSCFRHGKVLKVKIMTFWPFTEKCAKLWSKLWMFSPEIFICFCQDQGGFVTCNNLSFFENSCHFLWAQQKIRGLQGIYSTILLEAAIHYLLWLYCSDFKNGMDLLSFNGSIFQPKRHKSCGTFLVLFSNFLTSSLFS